jgi:biotin transport system substrate-specific component
MRTEAATLRLAVFPRSGVLTRAALVVAGTLLVAGAAQISVKLPFTPVPITGQTFAVVLVGASLGAVSGTASLALYLLAGLVLPFYAGGNQGVDIVHGTSGGYIIGFIVAAGVTGFLAERRWDRRFSSSVGAMLTGNVIIYLVGLPWLWWQINPHPSLEKTLEYGLYPFVPGDLFKLYIAAAALPTAWRIVERVKGTRP